MEIVIEELGQGNKVIHRHKHHSESIVIGRCYTSDVIVDDLHVDPEHAKLLKVGGNWTVLDLSTVNGVKINDSKVYKDASLKNGDVITIGKVSFRVMTEKVDLKPTLQMTFVEDIIDVVKKPAVLAFSLLLFAVFYSLSLYQGSFYEVASSKVLLLTMSNMAWYIALPIVASTAAFALRQSPNIMGQMGVCFAMFNVISVITYVFSVVSFSIGDTIYLTVLFTLTQGGLLLLLVWLSWM
jgi:pSer/pThr/pTyr-binding forkhead associated (FHA) protein